MNKWLEYEKEKKKIKHLPRIEYEKELDKIVKKLGL